MAAIDPDSAKPERFDWNKLFTDTRFRGITFQVIAALSIIAFFGWLGMNAYFNLQALGKDISYSFLWEQADYDIGQKLIEYTSTDTHFRAAIVGILNTLLVAFFGCILATVVGVLVGVARLSNNWLLARLMSVYVEIFRNVPVLIWIIIVISIVAVLPSPLEFRGQEPEDVMLWGAFALTNQGIYMPKPIWEAGSGFVIWTFLASIVAIIAWRRYALHKLYSEGKLLPTNWVSLGLLILPTLLVFIIMGGPVSLEYPVLSRFGLRGGVQILDTFIALWIALSLYTAAFIAENVRAGIMAVSKGQTEAAASLGLRPSRIMSLVVLPQALRVIIPPVISQYLNLTKNSSLAAAIGYADITGTLGGITLNQTGRSFEAVTLLMLFYLVLSLLISLMGNIYNNAVKLKER